MPVQIHRPFPRALRAAGLTAALAFAALAGPAFGQEPGEPGATDQTMGPAAAKAYAPERLWELDEDAQRRVIAQEYSDQSDGRTIPDDQLRFYLDQVRFSRWPFSRVRSDITESLAGHGVSDPVSANTVRCESADGRARTCTPTWTGRSRLVRQLSNTTCTEGQNWSSTPGKIQVSGGCRAEFTEDLDTSGGGVPCESKDGKAETCQMPWAGKSKIMRQMSGARCVANQNWWTTPGQVRVSGGCRALFASVDGELAGAQLRCESVDGKYHECGNKLYGTPQVVQQLSSTHCTLDRNFGLRNGKLWVNLGCRAVFKVTDGASDGYKVTCESANGKFNECTWDHSRGPPRLQQKLSDRACQQGYSWGYNRRANLWVNYGCRAVFVPR